MSYARQSAWREIQAHLPPQHQLAPGEEPAEEWWPWRDHEVHLDCYRGPRAPAKVILFHGVGTNSRQLSTILGAPLHRRGFETIAIDLPEYGVTALNVPMSRVGAPLVRLAARTPLSGLRMPMRVASKMHMLVNDEATLRACLRDRTSAGNAMTMTFLDSYLAYRPVVEPEQFDVCPILLTQPGEDRWTPLHLSLLFLNRIERVPVTTVTLEGAVHYPIEATCLEQLTAAVEAFAREQVARQTAEKDGSTQR